MPKKYVRKAQQEKDAKTRKRVQALEAILDHPNATPEIKLAAIKALTTLEGHQEQLGLKDKEILQLKTEISHLEQQLDTNTQELESAHKKLQTLEESKKGCDARIEQLEADKKVLIGGRSDCDEQLAKAKTEISTTSNRADHAEADVAKLVQTLEFLADQFVPLEGREETGWKHYREKGMKLSRHWYQTLNFFEALRHRNELEELKGRMQEAKKQTRPILPHMGCYLQTDEQQHFAGILLYQLLVEEREKWLEKSLIEFFRTEGVDYSKWLKWNSDELVNNGGDHEWNEFIKARRAYRDAHERTHRGGVEPRV
jgi:DNA repair exonuclease SbcCD ATPase subunit